MKNKINTDEKQKKIILTGTKAPLKRHTSHETN